MMDGSVYAFSSRCVACIHMHDNTHVVFDRVCVCGAGVCVLAIYIYMHKDGGLHVCMQI